MAHHRDCRMSPFFPHCDCGETDRRDRLAQLETELTCLRESIQRLVDNAEEIRIESGTRATYRPKIVYASVLQDVLDGRLR